MSTPLTSDRMPFLAMALGFPAALMIMAALFIGVGVFNTFQALGRGAPDIAVRCDASSFPPVCTEYSVADDALFRVGIAVALFLTGIALWPIGFRHRYVWLDGTVVRVTWGERFALPLHRYDTRELKNLTVTQEARFTVSPIPNTSVTRVRQAPDRWRMRATYRNRSVNLGSYTTAQNAHAGKQCIVAAAR